MNLRNELITLSNDIIHKVEIQKISRKGDKMSECLKSKLVNTRKHHVCFGCGREISSGSQAFCETWVDDTINTTYLCRVCESFAGTVLKYDDEYSEHCLPEHDPELWECMRIEFEGGE